MQNLPHAGLITSAQCGHCTKLRGEDGIPRNSNEHFTPSFIRSVLKTHYSKRTVNFIELHVERLSSESDISEVNIYDLILSIHELRRLREINIENLQLGVGSSIVRISIKRGKGVTVHVEDGGSFIESPTLTEFFTDYYIWNTCPPEISNLRDKVRNKEPYSHDMNFSPIEYQHYCDDPRVFDKYLIERVFLFDVLYSKLVPIQIRNYEEVYPSWFLISENQWSRAMEDKHYKMFAKIAGKITDIDESGEYKLRDSGRKNLLNELELYEKGDVRLEPKPRRGRVFA